MIPQYRAGGGEETSLYSLRYEHQTTCDIAGGEDVWCAVVRKHGSTCTKPRELVSTPAVARSNPEVLAIQAGCD